MDASNYILIIDFGSQTTHLIGRRLRDLGSKSKIVTPQEALTTISQNKPKGIILSGGPSSVYSNNAPKIDPKIFNTKIPLLAICYGLQITAYVLGGKVVSGRKEYGPAKLTITKSDSPIAKHLKSESIVWMSHGDEITKLPNGFTPLGFTPHVPYAFAINKQKSIYGLLFHPEVEHTRIGNQILENFILICKIDKSNHAFDIDKMILDIQKSVGDSYVIGAISGGVDSTVAGVLTARAIGKRFIPIYVENGLMRNGTAKFVMTIFKKQGIVPKIINVEEEMLKLLKGVEDSEKKRKIIGKLYIDVFEREMKKLLKQKIDVRFLMQGTIYSDVIESKGTKNAEKIKSHHNVGGLPKDMKLKLLEPVKNFYKDDVRNIGKQLGLPH